MFLCSLSQGYSGEGGGRQILNNKLVEKKYHPNLNVCSMGSNEKID